MEPILTIKGIELKDGDSTEEVEEYLELSLRTAGAGGYHAWRGRGLRLRKVHRPDRHPRHPPRPGRR
jgi:hypothetical protein